MHIEVYPSYSFLRQSELNVRNKIDRELAFWIEGIQFSPKFRMALRSGAWGGKQHFFSKASGKFPTGLLPIVQKLAELPDDKIVRYEGYQTDQVALMRAQEVAESIELRGVNLSGLQKSAIQTGCKSPARGRFTFATNSGKSEVGIGLVKCIGLPALWLTNRKELLRQYAERFKERTGMEAGMIGAGKHTVGDLMTVGIVNSMKTDTPEGKELLSRFKVLIVDECSHAQSKTWFGLCMKSQAPFRFGLTGTEPEDPLKLHRIMAATGSDLLGHVSNQELIESGWSAKPTIHLQTVNYPDNRMDYHTAYDEMIRSNVKYNSLIVEEIERWYKQGKTILVIVDRIRQGSTISSELSGKKINAKFLTGSHDGDYRHKTLAEFKCGKLQVLIATSILDEGVDVPAIEVLVLGAGGLSKGRQLQRIGRSLRRKQGENRVDVIDYIHMGNRYLTEHSLERVGIYKTEGFEIVWREPVDVR